MFTKSQLRRLRKTARRLQAEAGNGPFGLTRLGEYAFVGGRLVTGRLKHYHAEGECLPGEQCYQARDGGHYTYGSRLALGGEGDPSGFEALFRSQPGADVFRKAGIGPYAAQ